MRSADDVLDDLVRRLHEPVEPDADLCREIGCGDLESLLFTHEEQLWPRIEQLAISDPRFRRALASVWAYNSPAFERREALLASLGEFWSEHIGFVASRTGFGDDAEPAWRAFTHEGQLTKGDLALVLRSIAEWLEREENHTSAPRAKSAVRGDTGPWRSPEAMIRAFLDPVSVATWAVRTHGNRGVGFVVPASDPGRTVWMPCSRDAEGRWHLWNTRGSPGWLAGPDGDGIYVEEVARVDAEVELVHVSVTGRGSLDEEPVAGRVLLVHWDAPRGFVPPSHDIAGYRRRGVWTDT